MKKAVVTLLVLSIALCMFTMAACNNGVPVSNDNATPDSISVATDTNESTITLSTESTIALTPTTPTELNNQSKEKNTEATQPTTNMANDNSSGSSQGQNTTRNNQTVNSSSNNTSKNNATTNKNNSSSSQGTASSTTNNVSGSTSKGTWHEAVYKTVTHPAETKQVWVVDKEAYSYEEPVYEEHGRTICNDCGADITNNPGYHAANELLNGGKGSYRDEWVQVQVGTKTVTVPEQGHYETVVVKEAWTEKILVREAGYY